MYVCISGQEGNMLVVAARQDHYLHFVDLESGMVTLLRLQCATCDIQPATWLSGIQLLVPLAIPSLLPCLTHLLCATLCSTHSSAWYMPGHAAIAKSIRVYI